MESPAETCNPGMIENGLVAVTAMYQLTKQQTDLSVTLANSSLWIFSCYKHGWGDLLHKEQEQNHSLKDAFVVRQRLILQTQF